MKLDTVLRTLKLHNAFAAGELAIVAVSGGGDSVALLHILDRLKDELGIRLHVASLNHRIRAEAGRQDLDFVARLATRWNIPFTVDQADVPRLAKEWGIGVEEAARRARYAFLARVARAHGSKCVATGHHELDQAETILMNMVRGSGTRGLRGMQVVSEMPAHKGIRLVRPLLRVSKRQLEAYCLRHKLPYRDDASNDDIGYRRNFVRHEVISRLQSLNPNFLDAFDRLSETAAMDEDFLASHFDEAVMPMLTVSAARWSIGKDDFAALHPALQRRLVRRAFGDISVASPVLSYALTLDLIVWAQGANSGDRRDMNAVTQMRMDYDEVHIERKGAQVAYETYRLIPADTDKPILAGASLRFHGLTVGLSTERLLPKGGESLPLPSGIELRLRTRRPGDRFKPKGMDGRSRKIKDWMIDRKIPRDIRSRIPMVCAENAVIAICVGATWHLADSSGIELCEANTLKLWLA
ncbi:MAG: tRNA lysidine(34) synthetase TilS [Chloroflexi bacterium]|nr:tRNA lysidine(34) synthetase TilS [Chloroflexota bacterium]